MRFVELSYKTLAVFLSILSGTFVCIANSMIFSNISDGQGLGDPLVQTIYQDELGMIWLGTASTLECFDGVHIRQLQIPGEQASRKRVQCILSDEESNLWVGNGDGLWCLSHDGVSLQPVGRDVLHTGVNALALNYRNELYVASNKGLFIYDIATDAIRQSLVHANELAPNNVLTGLCLLPMGELWATSNDGLCCYVPDNGQWQTYSCTELPHQGFRHIVHVGDKLFFGSLDNGLFSFDLQTRTFVKGPELNCQVVYDLAVGQDGLLYVGTDGYGVFVIDTESNRIVGHFRHGEGNSDISSNSVYSLWCGKSGQLWIGFYQHGFDYSLYQSNQINTFPGTEGLAVRSFAKHEEQYLIGYRGGLLFQDESNGNRHVFTPAELNCQIVFSILWHDGLFYVGTYGGGLYTLDTATLKLKKFPDFSEREIFCLAADASGNLWIATGGGLYCFKDGKQIHAFNHANSVLPRGNVYEVFFDSTGRGWVCTDNGLCVYDVFSHSLRTDVFPSEFNRQEKIRNVYEDADHQLYFVPDKGDILVTDLKLNKVSSLTESTPMDGLDGRFVTEDADGKLWIGTQRGLFSIDKERNFRQFNFSNGLTNQSFTLCKPVQDDGKLWMGNESGLLYIDQHLGILRLASDSAHCVFGLVADGEQLPFSHDELFLQGNVELPSQPVDLTFQLTEFTFTKPSCMNYEYRMDGVDDEWLPMDGISEVTYHNLKCGRHTFHVRNCSDPRVEHTLMLHIPMDASNWAHLFLYVALIVLCALLALWMYRKRETLLLLLARPQPVATVDNQAVEEKAASVSANANELEGDVDEGSEAVIENDKYRNVNLPEDECQHLISALTRCMEVDKIYTCQNLKLSDVAEKLGTTAYLLSYLFSQHIQVSYYDYVNGFRVEEFKRRAKTADMNIYTLSALAEQCGFNSRASFFRYFKKVTGQTPSEWCRENGVAE